jgi:assimilatory nitrate reductase catalytic subunit
MARPPITDEELIARYGPHLNEAPPGGWNAGLEIDKVVNTHCCFCGQQCGIKLKVRANEVVGFEPWYDFPFNEGKLCPKVSDICRAHPDRCCTHGTRGRPGRVPAVSWDHALTEWWRDPPDPGLPGGLAAMLSRLVDERELPHRQVRPSRVGHGNLD